MPICFDKKIAFIHIPKTGGRSFEEFLDIRQEKNFFSVTKTYTIDGVTYSPQHLTPALLRPMVPGWESLTTICFTRNPYPRAVSEFFWVHKQAHPEKKPLEVFDEAEFIKWLREDLALKDTDHKIEQVRYTEGCQHVFKIENMDNQLEEIGSALGITIAEPLPRENRNALSTSDIVTSLSGESLEVIRELYAEDFQSLDYQSYLM